MKLDEIQYNTIDIVEQFDLVKSKHKSFLDKILYNAI